MWWNDMSKYQSLLSQEWTLTNPVDLYDRKFLGKFWPDWNWNLLQLVTTIRARSLPGPAPISWQNDKIPPNILHKISQGNLCYEIWQIFMPLLALISCLSLCNTCNNVEGVKIVMLDGYLGIGPFVSSWVLSPPSLLPDALYHARIDTRYSAPCKPPHP